MLFIVNTLKLDTHLYSQIIIHPLTIYFKYESIQANWFGIAFAAHMMVTLALPHTHACHPHHLSGDPTYTAVQCKWDRLTGGVGGRRVCGEGQELLSSNCTTQPSDKYGSTHDKYGSTRPLRQPTTAPGQVVKQAVFVILNIYTVSQKNFPPLNSL